MHGVWYPADIQDSYTRKKTNVMLAHWNNSPWIDFSLHSDTLSWFRAKSLFLLLKNTYVEEKHQIPMVWSLVWPD